MENSDFPRTIWDGTTSSRNYLENAAPNNIDYQRLVAEIAAVQNHTRHPTIINVDPGESIQAAIDSASAGDVILVAPSTDFYIGDIVLKSGISIFGSAPGLCKIQGDISWLPTVAVNPYENLFSSSLTDICRLHNMTINGDLLLDGTGILDGVSADIECFDAFPMTIHMDGPEFLASITYRGTDYTPEGSGPSVTLRGSTFFLCINTVIDSFDVGDTSVLQSRHCVFVNPSAVEDAAYLFVFASEVNCDVDINTSAIASFTSCLIQGGAITVHTAASMIGCTLYFETVAGTGTVDLSGCTFKSATFSITGAVTGLQATGSVTTNAGPGSKDVTLAPPQPDTNYRVVLTEVGASAGDPVSVTKANDKFTVYDTTGTRTFDYVLIPDRT